MEDYGPDILTVIDDDGNEQQFEVLDRIETDEDKRYVAIVPYYEDVADILQDDGELIILRVIEDEDENILEPIEDEDEFDEIAAIFEERLSEFYDFDGEEDE